MKATGYENDSELPAVGRHPAICCRVIDIGTRSGTNEGGNWSSRYVLIEWVLPHSPKNDGNPVRINRRFPFNFSRTSQLRTALESWRGRAFTKEQLSDFDIRAIAGAPCMIGIKHDRGYANFDGLGPYRGAEPLAMPEGAVSLSLEPSEFDEGVYQELPSFIQKLIEESPEFGVLRGAMPSEGRQVIEDSDDVPF